MVLLTIVSAWLPDGLLVANLDGLVESDWLVLDVALFDKVFVAVFDLLGHVVGGVGGVAPLVVAVVALDRIVVHSLLNHHDFLDTPGSGGGHVPNVDGHVVVDVAGVLLGQPRVQT